MTLASKVDKIVKRKDEKPHISQDPKQQQK